MAKFETWDGRSDHLYAVCVRKSHPEIGYQLDMDSITTQGVEDLYHVYINEDSYNSFHEAENWRVNRVEGSVVFCEPRSERLYSTVELSNVAVLSDFDLPSFDLCPGCRSPVTKGVADETNTAYCSVSCMNEVKY